MRFGIVGTNFVSEWFAAAARECGDAVEATAVYSRSAERADEFAHANGLSLSFDDLDAMLAAVDAVYIASPNRAHHWQALRAIEAGRHVMIEKTMATSLAEVTEIFDAAEARGVVAMEAMRNVHSPGHAAIAGAIPQLGVLREARIEKLQYSSRYDAFLAGDVPNAFDPTLGNSALADIGVYALQPALDWFGAPLRSTGSRIQLPNGFEGAGTMQLAYPGFLVDLSWSKISGRVADSYIVGELGGVRFDDPGEPTRVELCLRGEAPVTIFEGPAQPRATFEPQIRDFAAQVQASATDPRWRDLSLLTRELMDRQLETASIA